MSDYKTASAEVSQWSGDRPLVVNGRIDMAELRSRVSEAVDVGIREGKSVIIGMGYEDFMVLFNRLVELEARERGDA